MSPFEGFWKYIISVVLITGFIWTYNQAPFLFESPRFIISSDDIKYNDYTPFNRPISLENASAVFNLINGVAANKDQNIYPNGVAFLPAYISEGTMLYHGNNHGEIPAGVGWTALDYEFSYAFIGLTSHKKQQASQLQHVIEAEGLYPGGSHKPPAKDRNTILAFEVVKPLNKLIFFDGASGAKGSGGELDTQMILGNVPKGEDESEYSFVESVCKWGRSWGLDGLIRVETGFEVIICDMHSPKLTLSSNTTLEWFENLSGIPNDNTNEIESILNKVKHAAAYDQKKMGNAHDKRDRRILIDFKGLSTPLNKTWIHTDPYERRLINIPQALKDETRKSIENYLKSDGHADPFSGTDWQLVSNEIVAKFSDILQLLSIYLEPLDFENSSDFDLMQVVTNVTVLTGNFVRRFSDFQLVDDKYNQMREAKLKAVYEYAHFHAGLATESEILIWSSFIKVTEALVDMMFEFFDVSNKMVVRSIVEKKPLGDLKSQFQSIKIQFMELFQLLNWSSFYDCDHKCGLDSVCLTPFALRGARRFPKTLQCTSYL